MEQHTVVFVGLDVAKARHAVAVAEDGRQGEVRYLGEIDADTESVRRLVAKLEKRHARLHFCYEAGPTGYGLHRQLTTLGHLCTVVAPSLIPRKPGDRVKTDQRDAVQLARLLRSGDLTPVWVPDEAHEALRDLVRVRDDARTEGLRAKHHLSKFLLRQGVSAPARVGRAWSAKHQAWLNTLTFRDRAAQVTFDDYLACVRASTERIRRLDADPCSQVSEMLFSYRELFRQSRALKRRQ